MPQASGSADRDTAQRNAPRLTIGEVLARLRGEFPDVTNVTDFFLDRRSGFVTGQCIYLGGV